MAKIIPPLISFTRDVSNPHNPSNPKGIFFMILRDIYATNTTIVISVRGKCSKLMLKVEEDIAIFKIVLSHRIRDITSSNLLNKSDKGKKHIIFLNILYRFD